MPLAKHPVVNVPYSSGQPTFTFGSAVLCRLRARCHRPQSRFSPRNCLSASAHGSRMLGSVQSFRHSALAEMRFRPVLAKNRIWALECREIRRHCLAGRTTRHEAQRAVSLISMQTNTQRQESQAF
jgi:hypothetical protein